VTIFCADRHEDICPALIRKLRLEGPCRPYGPPTYPIDIPTLSQITGPTFTWHAILQPAIHTTASVRIMRSAATNIACTVWPGYTLSSM